MTAPSPVLLQGTWALVRWEIAYSDGRPPTLPYGVDATGLIVYSADGWMNAGSGRAGRPRLSSDSVRSAPEAERLAAFESWFQYAGPYELREREGRLQVVHRVTHALNPHFVGTDQVRHVDFDADGTLTLSASDQVPGSTVERHHRLRWRRAGR
ncbi:MAG: lipocalin-like domain-containing protein [Rubrivivax sp.]